LDPRFTAQQASSEIEFAAKQNVMMMMALLILLSLQQNRT
jgi:hypothetical protein